MEKKIEEVMEEVIRVRREFHMYPELSEEEFETHNRIVGYLESWGIEHEANVAGTGVVAIIRGHKPGRTIGLRADIDALPIYESNDLPYKSRHDGIMHACGHDVHTAIHLGVAKILKEMEYELEGNVKIFFQPAEETVGGAARMIKEGHMWNPTVEYMLGLHVEPGLPVGSIELKRGKLNASIDEFIIDIKGKSGHGSRPEDSVDPIIIASHIVIALQTLISRNTSPLDSLVLSIGKINGGTKNHIIPYNVQMAGSLRALDMETRAFAKNRISEIVDMTAKIYGGEGNVEFLEEGSYLPLINSDELVDLIIDIAREELGEENIYMKEKPSMSVDDFSFFSTLVPSCFYFIGCGDDSGNYGSIHSSNFMVDEDCLRVGLNLQLKAVLKLLKK